MLDIFLPLIFVLIFLFIGHRYTLNVTLPLIEFYTSFQRIHMIHIVFNQEFVTRLLHRNYPIISESLHLTLSFTLSSR